MFDLSNPEFTLDYNDYLPIDSIQNRTSTYNKSADYYEELLVRALIERAQLRDSSVTLQDFSKIRPHIENILSWLRTTDFYSSPASTKYHESYKGGLLYHTLQAYNQLLSLRSVQKFQYVVDHQWWSAVLAILVHDWCKIGRYESYMKNVKDEATGNWEQVLVYKIKEDGVTRFGHGTQSLIMIMQLCNSSLTSLTFEEMAAIRWHMDSWDIGHYDEGDLAKCNEKIPMVRMIQFADQLAITTY